MLDDQSGAEHRDGRSPDAPAARNRADLPRSHDATPSPDREPERTGSSRDGRGGRGEKTPSPIRRHPVWFALGAILLVATGAAGFWYWLVFVHPYESTDDAFVAARQFSVAPKVSGYVVAVPVTDNQHVEAGSVLFQIDRRDYAAALREAQAQVASAEAAIRNIDAQIEAQRGSIAEAEAQVEQADAALAFARQEAARYQDLAQRGAGSIQQSQQSTSNLQQQQANLSRARAAVTVAQKQVGSLQAQRAGAEASLAQARAQEEQARLNLGYTTVTAAQAGRVVRLTGAVGQYAQAGQALGMFVPDDIWITANFKETQITDMRPGQDVDVEIDAYPDRTIKGRVESVQPGSGTAFSLLPAENATGNFVKVVQRVPVKIVVDHWPEDVAIGPGLSVVPTVRVR
ncbi:HlyD family secretion protein [Methylobacterium nodulans]|uniref:Secretion protein HlyD family protein n=1 Tax=Methylobacterium nodulans (strain LMG 21967 / CNCM I-2342 / ORS 2060) TaxID=460265 RepID=B8IAW3_METNO|nr:HlyD family secretion protein [Methylobacterium nodulans]ACL55356.1 secretion protein HlyD family protein [Methylobacterium nodulans ORS 2060]